jgi:hypothetical protein
MCEWQRRLCRGYSDLHDVLVVEPAVQVLAHAEDLVGLGLGFGRIVVPETDVSNMSADLV